MEVRLTTLVEINSEIAALKMDVSLLKEMVTLLAGRISKQLGNLIQVIPPEQSANSVIHHNCGGVGHYKRECPSPLKGEEYRQRPQRNS